MSRQGLLVLLSIGLLAACDGGDGTEPATTAFVATTVTSAPTPSESPPASTTAPVAGPEPASFAGREPYPDCGEDFSVSLDPMGPPSDERRCFLQANESAKAAELVAHEAGADQSVYRTNPDRTVDVYLPGGPAGDPPWQLYQCTGIAADDRRVFTLVGCGAPVDLD